MSGIQGILGIAVILLIAWGFSENKGEVRWKTVALTLAAQIVLALILIKVPFIYEVLQALTSVFAGIQSATMEGTRFVFGFLGSDANVFPGDFPFVLKDGSYVPMFAFVILPQILVFSILVAVFWHWGILPRVIKGIAWVMQRSLHIGGAVGLAAAASLFVGMVESPLVIRAYLKSLSRSEFFMVITCGMATVAGSIMGLYAAILGDVLGDAIGHIITASMINIFGAILIARIMIPGDKITGVDEMSEDGLSYDSTLDAITTGTTFGVRLVVNVGAMLIALIALVALVNLFLGWSDTSIRELFGWTAADGYEPLTLATILGWVFAPLAWVMGVEWQDAAAAGSLLGSKFVLNELVAYFELGAIGPSLQSHTNLIMTYALCGFTNLSSVGILIGGVSTIVPERRDELLQLGPRTLISGTLVACLTGTIAGLLHLF